MATPSRFPPSRFGLLPFRSPLLRKSLLLSFPRVTEMFQFTRFPLPVLCVQTGVTPHDGCRVSPFGHPRINAWSTAPRGFSQSPTSFIGRRRQGIHRWLFVAWKNKDARACSAVLKGRRAALAVRVVHDAEHAAGSGAKRSCHARGTLPQNGREDKIRHRASSRGKPAIDDAVRRTHQCTNWELVCTGSNECRPSMKQ